MGITNTRPLQNDITDDLYSCNRNKNDNASIFKQLTENIDPCCDKIQFEHKSVRAWRYDNNQSKWRGRGKGQLTIYRNSKNNVAKILFEDDKHEKIRLLQYINGKTYAKRADLDDIKDECVEWYGQDYTIDCNKPMSGNWKIHFINNTSAAQKFLKIFNSFIDSMNDDDDDVYFDDEKDEKKDMFDDDDLKQDPLDGYKNQELIMQCADIGMDVIYCILANYLLIQEITNVSLTCTTMYETIKISKPICPQEVVLLHEHLDRYDQPTVFDRYLKQYERKNTNYLEFRFNENEFRLKNAEILEIHNFKNGALTSTILRYFDRVKKIIIYNSPFNNPRKYFYEYFETITKEISNKRNLKYVKTENIYYKLPNIRKLITTNMYTLKYFKCSNFSIDLSDKNNKYSLREYVSMVNNDDKDYEYGYKAYNEWHYYMNIKRDFKYLEKKYWLLNHSYIDKNYYITEHNRIKHEFDEYIEKQKKLDRENTNLKLSLDKMEEINKCIVCMENKREYIILYCGHFVLCGQCIKQYDYKQSAQNKSREEREYNFNDNSSSLSCGDNNSGSASGLTFNWNCNTTESNTLGGGNDDNDSSAVDCAVKWSWNSSPFNNSNAEKTDSNNENDSSSGFKWSWNSSKLNENTNTSNNSSSTGNENAGDNNTSRNWSWGNINNNTNNNTSSGFNSNWLNNSNDNDNDKNHNCPVCGKQIKDIIKVYQ